MHPRHPQKRQGGFREPPELLIVAAVLAFLSVLVLPAALKYHLGIVKPAIVILGGFVAFVLWLQHRNIIDWLRGRRWRGKKDK